MGKEIGKPNLFIELKIYEWKIKGGAITMMLRVLLDFLRLAMAIECELTRNPNLPFGFLGLLSLKYLSLFLNIEKV